MIVSRRIELSFDSDPETAAWFSDFLRRLLMGEATDPDWEAYRGIKLSGQAWSSEPTRTAATG